MSNPRARTSHLLVQSTGDDLIVFDQHRHLSHALNRTAALVFEHADGSRSVADLVALLQTELNETADEDLVLMTLDKLRRAHLLEEAGARSAEALRTSRRRFVRKIGLVGSLTLLLPSVETIVAPTSAMAQSGAAPGVGCESDSDSGCASNSASAACATNSASAGGPGGPCATNSASAGGASCNSDSDSASIFCAST